MGLLTPDLSTRLHNLLGKDGLIEDTEACRAMASDVFYTSENAVAVIVPGSVDALSGAVSTIQDAGLQIVPRGGGMSYTAGYVPHEEGAVIVDMSRMTAITEINAEDMYVSVEAGCTWHMLDEALAPLGLRTPFWGPFSGRFATIGGGMSQNTAFWGAGRYGSSVDSVIGFDIVIADGSLVKTGSAAHEGRAPFFRHYGPDLTGLFTADTGAMGIKARVTLRLMERPSDMGQMAFELSDAASATAALSDLARSGLVAEVYGFDPAMTGVRMRRRNIMEDAEKLLGVVKGSGGLLKGLAKGAKVAMSGRPEAITEKYTLFVNCEENSPEGLKAVMAKCVTMVESHSGVSVDANVPTVVRANPFSQSGDTLGPEGQVWAPVHAILQHSKALSAIHAVGAILESYAERMAQNGVEHGCLTSCLGTNGFVFEPVFYWHDKTPPPLQRVLERSGNEKAIRDGHAPEAKALVKELREVCLQALREAGSVHLQAGRFYDPMSSMDSTTRTVLKQVKFAVDPENRMNPGSLGL